MERDSVIQAEVNVSSVQFLSDGRLAATCADGKIRVWDARSGKLDKVVALDEGDGAPLLLGHTSSCAAIGANGAVKIWDLKTGSVVRRQSGAKPKFQQLAVSRDGELIAASGPTADTASDCTARLWDRTGKERFAVPAGLGGTSAMAISPDGATLVAGSYDTDIRAWSATNGEIVAHIEHLSVAMFALEFSPDGKVLATAGVDRVVHLFDTRTWKVTTKLAQQSEMIASLAFSKDGRLLATGGFSERGTKFPVQVIVRDVRSGSVVRRVTAPHWVRSVAFSDDGALLAHVSGDKTVALRAAREAASTRR